MNATFSRRDWLARLGRAGLVALPLALGRDAARGAWPDESQDKQPVGARPQGGSEVKLILSQLSMQRRLIARQAPAGADAAQQAAAAPRLDTPGFLALAAEDRYKSLGVTGVELSVVMIELDPFFNLLPGGLPDPKAPTWAALRKKADETLPVHRLLIDKDAFTSTDVRAGNRKYDPEGWYGRWLEVAGVLGCKEVTLLLEPVGDYDAQLGLAATRLTALCKKAAGIGELNVRVEPRGQLATDGRWLAALNERVEAQPPERFGILLNLASLTYDPRLVLDELGDAARAVVLEFRTFGRLVGGPEGGGEEQIRERSIPYQDYVVRDEGAGGQGRGRPFLSAPVTVRFRGSQDEGEGSALALRAARQICSPKAGR